MINMFILPEKLMAASENKMKILFVCSANIWRSPMAEGIMRELRPDWFVDSAGICAVGGDAPDRHAVACAAQRGVDISALRSRPVFAEDFANFDLILTMDDDSADYLELRRPLGDERYQRAKIDNLASYAQESFVTNPYGSSNFDHVYRLIEKACQNLSQKF